MLVEGSFVFGRWLSDFPGWFLEEVVALVGAMVEASLEVGGHTLRLSSCVPRGVRGVREESLRCWLPCLPLKAGGYCSLMGRLVLA